MNHFYAFASVKLPSTDELQRVFNIVNENRQKYEKHNEAIEKAIGILNRMGQLKMHGLHWHLQMN